jgi:hypothetical protein
MMVPHTVTLSTIQELKSFVRKVLCAHDRLDPEQTALREAPIFQSEKPCGLFFQVLGPRSLRTYAIWASNEERVLFYDSAGVRFGVTKLASSPNLRKAA